MLAFPPKTKTVNYPGRAVSSHEQKGFHGTDTERFTRNLWHPIIPPTAEELALGRQIGRAVEGAIEYVDKISGVGLDRHGDGEQMLVILKSVTEYVHWLPPQGFLDLRSLGPLFSRSLAAVHRE